MKIAFDAKRFFHNTSGLGNYSRDLVRILAKYSPKDEFVLLAEKQSQRGKDILSFPKSFSTRFSHSLSSSLE